MHHLVFIPDRNSDGKGDFTGAFEPESDRYKTFHVGRGDTAQIHRIDISHGASKRLAQVEEALRATTFDRLAFFCHGTRHWLQLGMASKTEVEQARLMGTAKVIAASSTPTLRIALYACGTGAGEDETEGVPGGEGGFADLLRDALCAAGRSDVWVFAHTSAGHTTRNPDVRFFPGLGSPYGQVGGLDVARRHTPEYSRLRELLKHPTNGFRFEIPYLTIPEIQARILAPA